MEGQISEALVRRRVMRDVLSGPTIFVAHGTSIAIIFVAHCAVPTIESRYYHKCVKTADLG